MARLGVAIGGVAFAVVVALGFRHGTPTGGGHVATSDPKAVVESSQGTHNRTSRSRRKTSTSRFSHLTSYSDGSVQAGRHCADDDARERTAKFKIHRQRGACRKRRDRVRASPAT